MEKEDLIQVIYNHDESLKRSIEQVKKDIEYQQDLLKLNEKHNKNTSNVQSKIDELRIILTTLENTQDDFNEEMNENDVDIKEIKETLLSNQANEAFPFPIPSFYNISRKNKLFSGREDILNNVFLQLAENNLVFLTGPGGIGKSQIARETVFQAKSKYELILWFSVNSEYDLVEEFNNAGLYYKLTYCAISNKTFKNL